MASVSEFVRTIDRYSKLFPRDRDVPISPEIRSKFENITTFMENFVESIDSPMTIFSGPVKITVGGKNESHSSSWVSIKSENDEIWNSTLFYFFPSHLFELAAIDRSIEVISPIIGASVRVKNVRFQVEISFKGNVTKSSGRHSCAFWQKNFWNESSCFYSFDRVESKHLCLCDHTTSFAFLFIPESVIAEIRTVQIVGLSISIVALLISLVFSFYRQWRMFRFKTIINTFALFTTLLFFLVFLVFFLQTENLCTKSSIQLAFASYFFFLLAFSSKTLLPIISISKIFLSSNIENFIFSHRFSILICVSLAFLFASIPTAILAIFHYEKENLFRSFGQNCWFKTQIVLLPFWILILFNLLLFLSTSVRLIQFAFKSETRNSRRKRIVLVTMISVASFVTFGLIWIFGPILPLLVDEKTRSTGSDVLQWLFALTTASEGILTLIINVIFYINERRRLKRGSFIRL